MRGRRFLIALALAAASCGAPPGGITVPQHAEEALAAGLPSIDEAQRAFGSKDWDAAIAAYAKAISAFGDDPSLGGWRDQGYYNIACAHARAGRAEQAAEAFARSVRNGLRPVVARGGDGAWRELPGLSLEHVVADADLDAIRATPEYAEAMRPYLAAGEPIVQFTRPPMGSRVPAVVVLAAEGQEAAKPLAAWIAGAQGRHLAIVALAGPVRPTPKDRRWTLGDGDDRWAVAKVREALDLVAKDPQIDPARVFIAGVGTRPGEAVWAAAMSEKSRLAGFAAPGARFHAAWHADAITALSASWSVVLGPSDAEAEGTLRARGIASARVEMATEETTIAAAILAAMLGPR